MNPSLMTTRRGLLLPQDLGAIEGRIRIKQTGMTSSPWVSRMRRGATSADDAPAVGRGVGTDERAGGLGRVDDFVPAEPDGSAEPAQGGVAVLRELVALRDRDRAFDVAHAAAGGFDCIDDAVVVSE